LARDTVRRSSLTSWKEWGEYQELTLSITPQYRGYLPGKGQSADCWTLLTLATLAYCCLPPVEDLACPPGSGTKNM
jgi:hypothetical protein